ncbi:MAG: DNA recombination protein RmuC [Propioniciclava sp.]|uniref:DNA recombination protein RmuC n=1 Tax=Propioniciclava sp. TaxID=2038686 RepID=UPI0039E56D38
MDSLGIILLTLIVGIALGALGAWVVLRRSTAQAVTADAAASDRLRAAEASARADAERARADLAATELRVKDAEVRLAEAHSEAERARRLIAEAHAQVSDAQSDAARHQAETARWEAKVVAAVAERDAALARAAEIAADRDAAVKEFKLASGHALDEQHRKAEASAEQRLKATEQLMAPIREGLAQFNARLAEVEKSRVEMSTQLRDQVAAVRVTGEELRRETSALSKALRKPQVRGTWGEMQLKRVAELAGMVEHCDFALQQTSTTSEDRTIRPDMKVMLSEGKFVYVDSKVPLTSFLDAHETSDEAEQQKLLASFARNVRSHVDQLSGKNYFKADTSTPEFVVLFIPSEALAAEALAQIPDLHEYAAGKGIVLATPTTLIAMLRAVAYSWKQAALADSAAEVFQLGRELYDRLGTMGGHFDRIGRSLSSTVKAYNEALGSMESRVLVSARRFRDLKVVEKELSALKPSEEHPRSITAPELVEDATATPTLVGRTERSAAEARPAAEMLPEASVLRAEDPSVDALIEVTTAPAPARATGRRHA